MACLLTRSPRGLPSQPFYTATFISCTFGQSGTTARGLPRPLTWFPFNRVGLWNHQQANATAKLKKLIQITTIKIQKYHVCLIFYTYSHYGGYTMLRIIWKSDVITTITVTAINDLYINIVTLSVTYIKKGHRLVTLLWSGCDSNAGPSA